MRYNQVYHKYQDYHFFLSFLLSSTMNFITKTLVYERQHPQQQQQQQSQQQMKKQQWWRYEFVYRCVLFVKSSITHVTLIAAKVDDYATSKTSTSCCCSKILLYRHRQQQSSLQHPLLLLYAHEIPELSGTELQLVLREKEIHHNRQNHRSTPTRSPRSPPQRRLDIDDDTNAVVMYAAEDDDDIVVDETELEKEKLLEFSSHVPHLMIQLIHETICTHDDHDDDDHDAFKFGGGDDDDGGGGGATPAAAAAAAAATAIGDSHEFDENSKVRKYYIDGGGDDEQQQVEDDPIQQQHQQQESTQPEKNNGSYEDGENNDDNNDDNKNNESTPLLLQSSTEPPENSNIKDVSRTSLQHKNKKRGGAAGFGGVSYSYSSTDGHVQPTDSPCCDGDDNSGDRPSNNARPLFIENDTFRSLNGMVYAYDGLLEIVSSSTNRESPTILLRRLSDSLIFIVVWLFPCFVIDILAIICAMITVLVVDCSDDDSIRIEQQQPDLTNNDGSFVDEEDDDNETTTKSEMIFFLSVVAVIFGTSSMLVFFWTFMFLRLQTAIEYFEAFGRTGRQIQTSSCCCWCCGARRGGHCHRHYDESATEDETNVCYRQFLEQVLQLVESLDGPEWSSALEYKLHPNAEDAVLVGGV